MARDIAVGERESAAASSEEEIPSLADTSVIILEVRSGNPVS
jgi:hypothetical protein